MNFLETYGKEIVALLIPLITYALNTFFKAKARLLWASPHTFTFLVPEPLVDKDGKQTSPTQTVHTISHMIKNDGKETATNVELLFNWKPQFINVWPPRHFNERIELDGRYTLLFKSLIPNENLGCELLAVNNDLPSLLIVRCDQCVAQTITMYPQPVIKNWQRRIGIVLALAGFALVVYLTIVLLQFLVLKTPFGH